jgi:hypothetical protein
VPVFAVRVRDGWIEIGPGAEGLMHGEEAGEEGGT